ncbi:MAG: EutN/CcmL family microcompartment protein [Chloroflexi bacterium]|nr:EutN/CcmL family microcompartment protein [Chloroflexota bacterium]
MLLGKVAGTLVASRKEASLSGLKFLVLKQLDLEGNETGGYRVAADAVGAGIGEVVLYATGSAARQTEMTHERPCDGVIMAIVDLIEVDGAVTYDKSEVS